MARFLGVDRSRRVMFGMKINSVLALIILTLGVRATDVASMATAATLDQSFGQPVDIAPSAYTYRCDREPDNNPPESWILLMQYAGMPFDKKVDPAATAFSAILCGWIWEEVRPVRFVELAWPATSKRQPQPGEIVVSFFDGTDSTAHTWWNPRKIREAGPPQISADGHTFTYAIPVDTWGVVVTTPARRARTYDVPTVSVRVPELWKQMELEIEWGFDSQMAELDYGGRVEIYDGILGNVNALSADSGTRVSGPTAWGSTRKGNGRRGLTLSVLYMGSSRWRRVWPYHAQFEDVAHTILTLWTKSGNVSFQVSDLEQGPILAPEYGFFLRATARRALPIPPANTGLAKSSPATLTDKMDSIPGVPLVNGWSLKGMPWFGVNPTGETGKAGSLTIPPRAVAMHPAPDRDVAVAWRSPIHNRVNVEGKVAMCDATGGNGIEWSLVHESTTGRVVLASGSINAGGSQAFPRQEDAAKLTGIAVGPDDRISLVIGPKAGDHTCDTTVIELRITEADGQQRVWNLAKDVVDSIHAGNPHDDSFGNKGVWHFNASEPQPPPPSPSEPPFNLASNAETAKAFIQELASKGLKTTRQRVREHSEQTWEEAVAAMRPGETFPPHPQPQFRPAMTISVPSEQLTAQWNLGAWHIMRRTIRSQDGKWFFNDYPFGILASETYMLLRALDLQGMHAEAADGMDQWLRLPMSPVVVPGSGGHHQWALPDRPLGHFSDGRGCLTHAEGSPGAGGHMDGVHCMGPGAIMFALFEHFRLSGDTNWLRASAPRMKANAEWILRQRQLLTHNLPNGQQLWSKGLQPAHVVTPDSERMHMQFYETEAYYWLAVRNMADLLSVMDRKQGTELAHEAEAYRKDLLASIDRSIALTPVVPVRDGTYHSFIPFAPYVRGFASGAWGWRRCQGHVGAIYWDTVQSADPLISPSRLLSPQDRRVQGHLDVLEDRLLLENTKVNTRTANYDPAKDWFAHASWQYQCGLERHANIHLAADDAPDFIRSFLNQYAVDIMPGEYTFREHTTGGPPDKIYEESCFLERFRQMLVMEDSGSLWLARATPRAWLEQGKKIAVQNAPTHFGTLSYEIVSDVDQGSITAKIDIIGRHSTAPVLLRLRHPQAAPIKSVELNRKTWKDFDATKELIRFNQLKGPVTITARY